MSKTLYRGGEILKGQIKELIRGSVGEMLNSLPEADMKEKA